MRKKWVVAAMSGGVDSSVAAALLQRQGYEVIGLTMCFGFKEAGKKRPSCCGIEGIEDASRVAHTLGIKHYVLNFDKYLQREVINNFISEYLRGRTPNPCIRCNQYLKFERLLAKAKSLGAEYLATGHYARIAARTLKRAQGRQSDSAKYQLKKAKDRFKDQSYFLYRLNQGQLRYILFPLGDYTKTEVRKLAGEFGLPVKDKPGSQEICFIPDDDYREFLRREFTLIKNADLGEGKAQINANVKSGPIVDIEGKILGEHKGIPFYTVGQREGLGIAAGHPIYIIKIDPKNNVIVAGKKEDVLSRGLTAGDLSFTDKPFKRGIAISAKIRYNHQEISSKAVPLGEDKVKIIFSKPQFAVTPGQAVVFYRGDEVVGGGVIEGPLSDAEISRANK